MERATSSDSKPATWVPASKLDLQEGPEENKPMVVLKQAFLDKRARAQKSLPLVRNWKRRWFILQRDRISYHKEPGSNEIGHIKLLGVSVVQHAEDKTLYVGREGDTLSLRFKATKEMQDWARCIEECEKQEAGLHKMTVEKDKIVNEANHTVIIDVGSADVKAGFASGDRLPSVWYPSVVGLPKPGGALEGKYCGFNAFAKDVRGHLVKTHPFNPSKEYDWPGYEELVQDVFQNQLKVSPEEYKVILVAPQHSTSENKAAMAKILLQKLGVAAVFIQQQAVLSLYAYGCTTGLCVDIGDRVDVVPINQGFIINSGVARLQYGGRDVTTYLTRLMAGEGYRFSTDIQAFLVRYIKEKVGLVASASLADEIAPAIVDVSKFDLGEDLKEIKLERAHYECMEGLFNPQLFGKDNVGVAQLVCEALAAFDPETRRDMSQNIFLSGGCTRCPGFAGRLKAEVEKLLPYEASVQVHASENGQFAAFSGGCVVNGLAQFDDMLLWREDYLNTGIIPKTALGGVV